MPQVSVVLPVYNAESTILRAIRSILAQSLTDLELLVVDDGSTDGTREIAASVQDARLRIVSLSHGGVATAANVGTQSAQSDIIARMDADDVAHPLRLASQLSFLNSKNLDAVGCRIRILNSDGSRTTTLQRYERWINEETLSTDQIHALRFVELPLVNPTILARRKYFELQFRNDHRPEDYDLLLRAAGAGMQFGKVDEVLFDWYDGKTRLTRRDSRYSAEAFMDCRRLRLREGPLAGRSQVDLWGAGQTGKPWLRWLQSEGITVRRVYDVNPRKIGRDIHGVRVVAPEGMSRADAIPLVIAVGADGTRKVIREFIEPFGYVPGRNAWFVA